MNNTDQNELPEPWMPSIEVQESVKGLDLDKIIDTEKLHSTIRGLAIFAKREGDNYGTSGYFLSALSAEDLSYYENLYELYEKADGLVAQEAAQNLILVSMLLLRIEGLTEIDSEESLKALARFKTLLQIEYISRKSGILIEYKNMSVSTLPENAKHLEKVVADGKTVVQWQDFLKGE